jgi:hypothetical protein
VPDYIEKIVADFIGCFKAFSLKFKMQSGGMTPADWKKKVD